MLLQNSPEIKCPPPWLAPRNCRIRNPSAAAVVTPSSDPWNQITFAAPMMVLYILSIGIAWMFGRRPARADKL